MKGIVFVHFLEMVEKEFGFEMADQIIESSQLKTNGAYTTVGTYDHKELLALVTNLSDRTQIPVSQLVNVFGKKMFGILAASLPDMIKEMDDVFSLLENVEKIIHVEVKKLYPDAELPTFKHKRLSRNCMELIYSSPRPFENFAKGLIRGCIDYYSEPVVIKSMETLHSKKNRVRFVIERKE
jgi:hypothetical protein